MTPRRRVVITGLGVVAPNGIGKDAFWTNLLAGKSGVDWITSFDSDPFPCKVAGEVRDFHPGDFMTARQVRELWRFSQFAIASSRLALEDASFSIHPAHAQRVATCFGTCVNGFARVEIASQTLQSGNFASLDPMTCLQYGSHAPVSHVSIALGITGPSMTLSSGCSTGLDVIHWGVTQIQSGVVDAALVGTTEAPLCSLLFATFSALNALSTHYSSPHLASRPYDLTRDGIVLAEGSGALFLEELDAALDRGATIYAEVTGYGLASEALDLRKVDLTGSAIARAIRTALASASLGPGDVDYIHGHGNSLPDYDLAETLGIKMALGPRAHAVPISSIKSMIGQPISAAGSLQAISSALTIRHGWIPPTINYRVPDPQCDLDYVPNKARLARIRHILVNSHAAGGTHSVLALARYP